MPIPDFQTIMLPLLQFAADGKEHTRKEAIDYLAAYFKLTEAEITELLPSGNQEKFDNRVAWARSYMKQAKLIESTARGMFKITERGQGALKKNPNKINIPFLMQYPEFVEFRTRARGEGEAGQETAAESLTTPKEVLETGYQKIRNELAVDLIDAIKKCSPKFFENLVVELLIKMGYGGSRSEAGTAIGRSGDGGIDGIINEDRLGLDVIYIQAKRWDGSVGRPEIQKFVGALQGRRARKGVFITTSFFSNDAKDYAASIESKVILVDGDKLAQLMIDFEVGVSKVASYDIKRLDADYFSEE
jgi:restriction system protein